MSFLNPTLLAGLIPLVALPLLIHLLNKRFPQLFYFSSVEALKQTVAQRSTLFRLRHLILLLLRTLFLALLLLAFLKPALQKFGSGRPGGDQRHVLILLDHSMSMEYKGEALPARQRAQLEAEKLIHTLAPNDLLNVMVVGQNPTTCFVDFSANHAEAVRFLNALKPGLTRADFNKANAAAARHLGQVRGRSEIYYLSDYQRKNWANVDFTSLPPQARLFFIDVAAGTRNNRAILGASINQPQVLAGDTVTLEVTVGNFSDKPFQDRLTVLLDQRVSFDKDLSISPWSVAKATLPVPPGAPGLHRCEISLPPDDLAEDNRCFLAIPVLEKQEVLIVSDDPNPDKDAVYFLKTALNPYDKLQGSLLPKHLASSELSAVTLAGVKKIFLTRTGSLSDSAAHVLADFLFKGGGIIYFLDGQADADSLERLEKAIGPGTMPVKLTRRTKSVPTTPQQIIRGDFKSKYLRLFRGTLRQNLALLEFYDVAPAVSTGAGPILLTYADDTPAMAAMSHGLGTMLLLNFSVSEFSSNLARQRIFPAWMQELIKTIDSDEAAPTAWSVGDVVSTEVWRSELKDNAFRGPDGKEIALKRELTGERTAVSFVPEQPGFYTLSAGRLLYALPVNTNPDESDLRAVDKDVLPQEGKGTRHAFFLGGQDDYEDLVAGKPMFHWFVLAGALVLVLEMGFQMWFRRLAQ